MPAKRNTASPYQHQSLQDPNLHSGIVRVTGTFTVHLGIGHTNFVPTVSLQAPAGATDANAVTQVTWAYNPAVAGSFIISCWKPTSSSVTTLIAATAPALVSFIVIADSTVGL